MLGALHTSASHVTASYGSLAGLISCFLALQRVGLVPPSFSVAPTRNHAPLGTPINHHAPLGAPINHHALLGAPINYHAPLGASTSGATTPVTATGGSSTPVSGVECSTTVCTPVGGILSSPTNTHLLATTTSSTTLNTVFGAGIR